MDKIEVALFGDAIGFAANPYLVNITRVGVEFVWTRKKKNGTFLTQHRPLTCRDHVLDFMHWSAHPPRGATWGPKEEQDRGPDKDACRLMVKLYGKDAKKKFADNFEFVQRWEKEYLPNVSASKLFEVEFPGVNLEGTEYLLVEGDALWTKANCLNSYYTLLLRMCPNVGSPARTLTEIIKGTGADLSPTDRSYLVESNKNVPLDKYIAAMGKIDFKKANNPSGQELAAQYGHGIGGFHWTSVYVKDAHYYILEQRRNIYGDQILAAISKE